MPARATTCSSPHPFTLNPSTANEAEKEAPVADADASPQADAPKRKRGRPPGSKNKPKLSPPILSLEAYGIPLNALLSGSAGAAAAKGDGAGPSDDSGSPADDDEDAPEPSSRDGKAQANGAAKNGAGSAGAGAGAGGSGSGAPAIEAKRPPGRQRKPARPVMAQPAGAVTLLPSNSDDSSGGSSSGEEERQRRPTGQRRVSKPSSVPQVSPLFLPSRVRACGRPLSRAMLIYTPCS